MENPYRIDPDAYRQHQRTARAEHLVALQEESPRALPSVGTGAFHHILFGPAAGQPSAAGADVRPGWGRRLLRILFWPWAALALLGLLRVLSALLR